MNDPEMLAEVREYLRIRLERKADPADVEKALTDFDGSVTYDGYYYEIVDSLKNKIEQRLSEGVTHVWYHHATTGLEALIDDSGHFARSREEAYNEVIAELRSPSNPNPNLDVYDYSIWDLREELINLQ